MQVKQPRSILDTRKQRIFVEEWDVRMGCERRKEKCGYSSLRTGGFWRGLP